MKQEELQLAVRGAMIHAPAAGAIEILENALIAVDNTGQIAAVTSPGEPDYDKLEQTARDAGKLEELSAEEYLLPGLVDTHVHAPQWPQLGKALDRPLDVWLQKYTFPLEARYADLEFARARVRKPRPYPDRQRDDDGDVLRHDTPRGIKTPGADLPAKGATGAGRQDHDG